MAPSRAGPKQSGAAVRLPGGPLSLLTRRPLEVGPRYGEGGSAKGRVRFWRRLEGDALRRTFGKPSVGRAALTAAPATCLLRLPTFLENRRRCARPAPDEVAAAAPAGARRSLHLPGGWLADGWLVVYLARRAASGEHLALMARTLLTCCRLCSRRRRHTVWPCPVSLARASPPPPPPTQGTGGLLAESRACRRLRTAPSFSLANCTLYTSGLVPYMGSLSLALGPVLVARRSSLVARRRGRGCRRSEHTSAIGQRAWRARFSLCARTETARARIAAPPPSATPRNYGKVN